MNFVQILIYLYQNFLAFCEYIHLNEYIIPFFIKCFIVASAASVTYGLTIALSISLRKFSKKNNIDAHTRVILTKASNYSLIIFGGIFALQNIGIQVTPLITALGVSGVALSFGLKDIISNTVAGILIMIYQQFKIGDFVKIKDGQGKIVDINIRYTTLKTDDTTVYVPNSILYTTTVTIIHQKEENK